MIEEDRVNESIEGGFLIYVSYHSAQADHIFDAVTIYV
jgi:hypothetical protein